MCECEGVRDLRLESHVMADVRGRQWEGWNESNCQEMAVVWRGREMDGMTGCSERAVECLDVKKVPRLGSVETEKGGLTVGVLSVKVNETGSGMEWTTRRRASVLWGWEKKGKNWKA
jgi:hypothetical protein